MRRNHAKHSHINRCKNEYRLDYIILPERPEISHVIVKPMRTVYRNLAAWEHAPFSPTVKSNDDPLMALIMQHI